MSSPIGIPNAEQCRVNHGLKNGFCQSIVKNVTIRIHRLLP